MWLSSRSTTPTGLVAPSEHESDGDDELAMRYAEDSTLEEVMKDTNVELTQKDLTKLGCIGQMSWCLAILRDTR